MQPAPPARPWPLPVAAVLCSLGCLALAGGGPPPLPEPVPVTVVSAPAPEPPPPEPPGCDGDQVNAVLEAMALDLAAQRILYRSEPLSDCSGMAHRLLGRLHERCPELTLPRVWQARSASDLASWFQDAGQLVVVRSPEEADSWLVPGALAFFERRAGRGLDGVGHVGLVLSVERDPEGRVLSYSMFHGRQPGVVASITDWHVRDASPSLGNGPDALVGLAFPSPGVALAAPMLGGDGAITDLADGSEPDAGWDPVHEAL